MPGPSEACYGGKFNMQRVLVLGGSGMLGSMLVDFLSRDPELTVGGAVRNAALQSRFEALYPNVNWVQFDCDRPDILCSICDGQDWIINAIGVTKPLIRDDNAAEIHTAIRVNSLFPDEIGRAAQAHGASVLQIATDCVYSGTKGSYLEDDLHDARDVYGKTKSLGESFRPNMHHLRCSIIGPEPKDYKFLVEWFRRQPIGATVNGFLNHEWNGVTTLHFAKVCGAVIKQRIPLPHIQHLVPTATVSKAQMLQDFATAFARPDVKIQNVEASSIIDRTLATKWHDQNRALWRAAGYETPPTISEMILELGRYEFKPDSSRK
jgi:dTDP-4-dehydrorhamnose reductase